MRPVSHPASPNQRRRAASWHKNVQARAPNVRASVFSFCSAINDFEEEEKEDGVTASRTQTLRKGRARLRSPRESKGKHLRTWPECRTGYTKIMRAAEDKPAVIIEMEEKKGDDDDCADNVYYNVEENGEDGDCSCSSDSEEDGAEEHYASPNKGVCGCYVRRSHISHAHYVAGVKTFF